MPMKPFESLAVRRKAKPKTRLQKKAKTARAVNDQRLKNLEKARKVRAKNLRAKKKAARK